MFPASIRLSGVSLSYAIGAILGGAFSPTIAEFLDPDVRLGGSVGFYLVIWALISLVAVRTIKDRCQEPLHSISGRYPPARRTCPSRLRPWCPCRCWCRNVPP